MDARYVQSKLSRRQLLEIRRTAHEAYLKRRHGWWWSLSIEGDEAVLRRGVGAGWPDLTVRFPADDLFERDAMSRHGF